MPSHRPRLLSAGLLAVLITFILGGCKGERDDNSDTVVEATDTTTSLSVESPSDTAPSGTAEASLSTDTVAITESLPASSTVELPSTTDPRVVDIPRFEPGGPDGYIPLWQCIAPAFRPAVASQDDLRTIRPTPIQLAKGLMDMTFMRQPPCVRNLLDGGADINSHVPPGNDFGDGPALHLALNQKNWELAHYLLERGADPNAKTPYQGYSALDMALESFAPKKVIEELTKRGAKTAKH